jgi:two-component system nitrate/nitrite response regulator NarL
MNLSIVSSNSLSREGLSRIFISGGFVDTFCHSSLGDLLTNSAACLQLVLLDLPSQTDQISAVEIIAKNRSDAISFVLAESFDYQTMANCFANGAHGYLVKNVSAASLLAFLRVAVLGHKVMPPELAEQLQRDPCSHGDQTSSSVSLEEAGISRREEEVLGHLVAGQPNKSIARSLDVSEATVKVHVKAILRKLQLANRTQAALWANAHLSRTSYVKGTERLWPALGCVGINTPSRPDAVGPPAISSLNFSASTVVGLTGSIETRYKKPAALHEQGAQD